MTSQPSMDRETQLSEFCTLGLKRSSQEKLQLHLKGNATDLASLYRLPGGHRVQPGLQMKRGLDGGHQRCPPIPYLLGTAPVSYLSSGGCQTAFDSENLLGASSFPMGLQKIPE